MNKLPQVLFFVSILIFTFCFTSTVILFTVIPREFALNMPTNLICDYYHLSKRGWGCLIPITKNYYYLLIALHFVMFKMQKTYLVKDASYIILVLTYIFLVGALISLFRFFSYVVGDASTTYILQTIPFLISALLMFLWLRSQK